MIDTNVIIFCVCHCFSVVGKKQSVFGTSSVRTAPMIKVDETELPGKEWMNGKQ